MAVVQWQPPSEDLEVRFVGHVMRQDRVSHLRADTHSTHGTRHCFSQHNSASSVWSDVAALWSLPVTQQCDHLL